MDQLHAVDRSMGSPTSSTGQRGLFGNGKGAFGAAGSYKNEVAAFAARGAIASLVADVDEDGKLDVLTLSSESAQVGWLRGQAVSTFVVGASISTPVSNATGFVTCDANEDGHVDLVISGDSLHLLLGNGHGAFTDGGLLFGPTRCAAVTSGDVDGDGTPEVIAACDDALAHVFGI